MNDFTVLVLPGAYATSVAATLDVLHAASVLAPRLHLARPTWRVMSPSGGSVPVSSGMHIEAAALPKRFRSDGATWIVPGLGIDDASAIATRLTQEDARLAIQAVAAHAASGSHVAASCSAVFLLQAAGLLAQRRVTTSWWLAAQLQRLEPSCIVDADRMVCADSAVSTAGAAFAQTDLMLHLLRTRFGVALADAVSRVLLVDARQAQARFVAPTMLSNGNELIGRLVARIESALPHPPSIGVLADEFAMSQRTLARRVKAATGKSTLALVQSVRLNRARMLIESSRMAIEQVAEQVGYEDATALRRLMRKVAGVNPSQYRTGGQVPG
ncbi:GlxA family transcriptional regulator [Paraburkholderia phenazinium]|uniref:Transcriptional regulator GlxA family, contains an amidase domain and an AraC-type DNA-binding HTH domain n=1 Tax=Paraburkholderia phenazinium TaxID=60549 RepID=A0A1G8M3L4_9BURK|nr:helix-turn-helix domain-containing protein [Paraburkholderia phenazinium]SDI62501.1 Transcriptional regulator GlxA family, contains an amidase domain and an AraC-type DNA-binding HTH domain [Paraburkholderia phenazinium]